MTNRRQFLKNAGVVFTGCHLMNEHLHAQPAAAPKSAR